MTVAKPHTLVSSTEPQTQQEHGAHTLSDTDKTLTRDEDGPGDECLEPPGDAPRGMSAARRRIIMFSICLSLFLSALDTTIVATALPTIAHTLGANAAEYAWVGSSYTLASTSTTPVWAKLSDIYGRKSMLMGSNALFMAGSLVAAFAQTPAMLIGGRVLQGLGGGGSTVLVTIVIGDIFALEERAKYYGLTGLVYALSSSMGPVLGGVFTSTIGWRWCFYINLPFGAASLVMVFFAFKQPRTPVAFLEGLRALDWGGTVLVTGGAICFLLGLETGAGGAHPWGSAMVSCLLAFGAILLALFLLYETKFAKNPLVPTRIFRSVTNVACFILTCVHSFTFISYDYFLPLYYQAVLGFSPIISGVTMLALVVTLSVVTMGGGFFVRSTGDFLTPIRTGAVLMTLGTGLFISFGSATEWAKIILFELVAGLGVGPLFQCPMIALQSHVLPEDVAMASSAMTFSRNLFTSTSIVVGSVILQRALGAGSLTPGTGESEASNAAAVADKEEYASALRIMWIFYTCMSSLMVIASFFVKKRNLLQKQAEPTSPESIGEKGDPEKAQQWPTVAK